MTKISMSLKESQWLFKVTRLWGFQSSYIKLDLYLKCNSGTPVKPLVLFSANELSVYPLSQIWLSFMLLTHSVYALCFIVSHMYYELTVYHLALIAYR